MEEGVMVTSFFIESDHESSNEFDEEEEEEQQQLYDFLPFQQEFLIPLRDRAFSWDISCEDEVHPDVNSPNSNKIIIKTTKSIGSKRQHNDSKNNPSNSSSTDVVSDVTVATATPSGKKIKGSNNKKKADVGDTVKSSSSSSSGLATSTTSSSSSSRAQLKNVSKSNSKGGNNKKAATMKLMATIPDSPSSQLVDSQTAKNTLTNAQLHSELATPVPQQRVQQQSLHSSSINTSSGNGSSNNTVSFGGVYVKQENSEFAHLSSSSSSSSGSYRRAGVNDTDSSMNKSHGLPRGLRLLGSSPHTDWGFLTIIMADNVQGLQFLPKSVSTSIPGQKMEEEEEEEKRWIDVPHIPGSLVINAGDYLQLVSKGVYHSPVHRVLVPGTTTTSSTAGTSTSTSTSTSSIVSSSDTCNDSSSSNKSSNSSSTSSNNSCSSSGGRGEGHQQYTSAMSDADQKERNEATTTGTTTTTNDSDGDRYSMVFFFYPGYDNLVSDAVLGHCTHYSDNRSISHGSMASGTSVPDQSVSGSSSRSRSSSGGDTAAAGTVIGDGGGTSELSTPAKRMEKVGRQKHSPAYNTLLTMTTDSSSHMMGDPSDNKENLKNGDNHHHDIQNLIPSFGDYIIKKWMDVYRA
mmetsp:Transcript_6293/g.10455  ORF Transcript_6293/g.10455 Transcript_6293/m.10455 type:complete len:629 (-) Transcript_6293:1731-3617(-)